MIQLQTVLKVSDNSGGRTVKCIKVLGGFKRKAAKVGDIILVSVKSLRKKKRINSKVKKGEVYKAVVVRSKIKQRRKNGVLIKSFENSVSILNKKNVPLATRIKGLIDRKLRSNLKLVSISDGLI